MSFVPFAMERWQSTYENEVGVNLSESGVHPLTVGELLVLAGAGDGLEAVRLGYGYSNGSPALREAIAALYPDATPDNVVTFNGSAEANFLALWELIDPGDRVVLLLPAYMQSAGIARMRGARVREVWLREARGWQPDLEELRRACADARLVVVTNPNNPTGAVLSPEARSTLLAAASRNGAWILSDEVYAGAELDGPATSSLWGESERVVATGSLSKAYGLPGLRLGWAVAPTKTVARLWARGDYTTISHGPLTDRLGTLALRTDVREQILARTRAILRQNLPLADRLLGAAGFQYHPPSAGAILWARYPGTLPSAELAELARRIDDVLVVPGEHFLMEGFVRIGYGMPPHELAEGLTRLLHTLQRTVVAR
ncbi:MAG: aminotransferase class I/II-fold pyridoxal phosphate-dependent enzyme [Longimicrobiales bacterium]